MEVRINLSKKCNFAKILTIFGYILLLLLFIITFFLIEKYLLFTPIYSIIKLISYLFNLETIHYYSVFIVIVLIFLLHIFSVKIVILSIIFPLGGIFAKFHFYNNFKDFINKQDDFAKTALDSLYFSLNNFSNLVNSMSNIILFQKAYNNLKMIKHSTFEIKQNQIGGYLNEIVYQYNKYQESNYCSNEIKNNLINDLKLYRKSLEFYTNFSIIDIILKFKYKNFLQLLKELLKNSFKGRTCDWIKISNKFNIYIISPELENSEIKTLVIFCGQNACNAEMNSYSKNHLKLYLQFKEITLLIWNYRGYGLRPGFPTFRGIDKDIEILKEYIKNQFGEYKIIIHGISIGGYAAIKLAKSFNNEEKICLIADRTFADIDLIAGTFMKKGKIIYNFLFPKIFYKSNNIYNYIDVPIGNKFNKFIFFDENDSIIDYSKSSLIYNLTQKYYNEIIIPKISNYHQYKSLLKLITNDYKSLILDVKKIIYYSKKLDENSESFIKYLNRNIDDLDKFIMFFLVFGYPFNLYKEIYYDKNVFTKNYINMPEILRQIYEKNKFNFNKNILNFISYINFLFIKSNLIIPFIDDDIINFSFNNDANEFDLQEDLYGNLLKYFGYVHRIFCNHNGYLTESNKKNSDEKYLRKFFELNEFINSSNNE